MNKLLAIAALCALAGCGTSVSDRAVSGGAMGAGIGAIALGVPTFGIGFIPGAILGGAIGAGTGAEVPPDKLDLGKPVWK